MPRKPPGDTCASGQAPPPFLLGMRRTGQADLISWWPHSLIKTELCRATKVSHKGPHTDNTNPNGSATGLGWHSDSHLERPQPGRGCGPVRGVLWVQPGHRPLHISHSPHGGSRPGHHTAASLHRLPTGCSPHVWRSLFPRTASPPGSPLLPGATPTGPIS